jgi:PAS domain S-box-containing protein
VPRIRRLLKRPSLRLARSILIPLTAIHVAVTLYGMVVISRASDSIAFDRVEGIAEALAMTQPSNELGFSRIANRLEADRIWLVSATGRILASNRPAEVDGLVDDVWWQNLPVAERRFRRRAKWGGSDYVQVAYHDIERGVWAMVIAAVQPPRTQWPARMLAALILSVSVWLLMVGAVVAVVQRRLGRSLDVSDLVARRVLKGEAVSAATLARTQAATRSFGPGVRLLELVGKMQEQAARANEAESRFSLAVELLPGLAWLASYDGRLLYAGPALRQRFGSESWMGRLVTKAHGDIPFDRIHAAAEQSHARAVTFDNLPIREESPDLPALVVSIKSVVFQGTPAYLAHLEAVNDAGDRTQQSPVEAAGEVESQVIDAAQEIIIAFDSGTRTLIWNKAAARMTGASEQDVPDLKTAMRSLSGGEDSLAAFASWMDGTPEAESLVTEFEDPTGSRFTISWTAREITSDGRSVGGALFGVAVAQARPRDAGTRSRKLVSRNRRRKKETDSGRAGA